MHFLFDIQAAMSFYSKDVLTILPDEVKKSLRIDWDSHKVNEACQVITSRIITACQE